MPFNNWGPFDENSVPMNGVNILIENFNAEWPNLFSYVQLSQKKRLQILGRKIGLKPYFYSQISNNNFSI